MTAGRLRAAARRFAVVVVSVFVFAPAVWAKASVLYLVLVSLYANWSTDFRAMSAAEAAATGPVSAHAQDQAEP